MEKLIDNKTRVFNLESHCQTVNFQFLHSFKLSYVRQQFDQRRRTHRATGKVGRNRHLPSNYDPGGGTRRDMWHLAKRGDPSPSKQQQQVGRFSQCLIFISKLFYIYWERGVGRSVPVCFVVMFFFLRSDPLLRVSHLTMCCPLEKRRSSTLYCTDVKVASIAFPSIDLLHCIDRQSMGGVTCLIYK